MVWSSLPTKKVKNDTVLHIIWDEENFNKDLDLFLYGEDNDRLSPCTFTYTKINSLELK